MSAFLDFGPSGNLWNDLIVGFVAVVTSLTMLKDKPWQAWLAVIFGVWMIMAAFIPSLVEGTGYVNNDLISGIIIAIAGFASLGKSHQEKLA